MLINLDECFGTIHCYIRERPGLKYHGYIEDTLHYMVDNASVPKNNARVSRNKVIKWMEQKWHDKEPFKEKGVENGFGGILANVTTAIHGEGNGPVPKPDKGGWYEREGDTIVLHSDFIKAWKAAHD